MTETLPRERTSIALNAVATLLVATGASTICATVLGMVCRGLSPALAWTSLCVGALACLPQARNCCDPAKNPPAARISLPDQIAILCFCLFVIRAFGWLVFEKNGNVFVLSNYNYGDLPMHATFVSYFASGVPLWPQNPIFAGSKLHYPVGMDLFNALLVLAGADIWRSFVWTGLVAGFATLAALYPWGRGFTVAGFLFNGGIAGFMILQTHQWRDYQMDVSWASIPLTLLLPQRGMLYAIPAGLVLLTSWRARFFEKGRPEAREQLPFWVELFLYSTLPLFHFHTFLFLSFLLGVWFAAGIDRKQIAKLAACSVIPATCALHLIVGLFDSKSPPNPHLIHLSPGWDQGNKPFLIYWFTNFGFLPFYVAALCSKICGQLRRDWRGTWEGKKDLLLIGGPALVAFLVCCCVMFAPWNWDNIKLLMWGYLVFLPFLWKHLLKEQGRALQVVACIALFFSGFVSVAGGLDSTHTGLQIAQVAEYEGVRNATAGIPPEALFATYPSHNHPVALADRRIVMAFAGQVFTHGYDPGPHTAELETIFSGRNDWLATARRLGVDYLYWGRIEAARYPRSTQPWIGTCPVAASGPWGTIYNLAKYAPADKSGSGPLKRPAPKHLILL